MIYKNDPNKLIIEIENFDEGDLEEAIKGMLYCISCVNQDHYNFRYVRAAIILLESIIPNWKQIDLSKKPEQL